MIIVRIKLRRDTFSLEGCLPHETIWDIKLKVFKKVNMRPRFLEMVDKNLSDTCQISDLCTGGNTLSLHMYVKYANMSLSELNFDHPDYNHELRNMGKRWNNLKFGRQRNKSRTQKESGESSKESNFCELVMDAGLFGPFTTILEFLDPIELLFSLQHVSKLFHECVWFLLDKKLVKIEEKHFPVLFGKYFCVCEPLFYKLLSLLGKDLCCTRFYFEAVEHRLISPIGALKDTTPKIQNVGHGNYVLDYKNTLLKSAAYRKYHKSFVKLHDECGLSITKDVLQACILNEPPPELLRYAIVNRKIRYNFPSETFSYFISINRFDIVLDFLRSGLCCHDIRHLLHAVVQYIPEKLNLQFLQELIEWYKKWLRESPNHSVELNYKSDFVIFGIYIQDALGVMDWSVFEFIFGRNDYPSSIIAPMLNNLEKRGRSFINKYALDNKYLKDVYRPRYLLYQACLNNDLERVEHILEEYDPLIDSYTTKYYGNKCNYFKFEFFDPRITEFILSKYGNLIVFDNRCYIAAIEKKEFQLAETFLKKKYIDFSGDRLGWVKRMVIAEIKASRDIDRELFATQIFRNHFKLESEDGLIERDVLEILKCSLENNAEEITTECVNLIHGQDTTIRTSSVLLWLFLESPENEICKKIIREYYLKNLNSETLLDAMVGCVKFKNVDLAKAIMSCGKYKWSMKDDVLKVIRRTSFQQLGRRYRRVSNEEVSIFLRLLGMDELILKCKNFDVCNNLLNIVFDGFEVHDEGGCVDERKVICFECFEKIVDRITV